MKNFKKSCKILSLVLTLCMVCTFLPTVSFAEEENTSIFEITVNDDGTTCTVTGFKEDSMPTADGYELTIPETIAGYTVTAIGDNAFHVGTDYMTYTAGAVTLPDTVKSIGKYAFTYCKGIQIAAWPTALESVGQCAFNNAKNGSISCDFSKTNLKTISYGAFEYTASSMNTAVALPDTLTTIGKQAFQWTSIKEFVIPDSVTSLGDTVVKTCASLEKIRFPRNSSITEIPAKTFDTANTSNLFKKDMSIYIPSNITTIPSGLFDNFNTGVAVTIYGEAGSAAEDFYKASLADIENLTIGSVSWVEYDFVNEQSYNYADTGIYEGTKTLSLTGTDESVPATVTANVSGVYGKAADDVVYKMDTYGGNSGKNYIGIGHKTLDYETMEISFVMDENSPQMIFAGGFYTAANTTDSATSGTFLNITDSMVTTGSLSLIESGSRNTKLCDIEAEQWTSVAVVVPGYNQLEKASDKIYVYVNGSEYTIPLATPIYGTRHMRFSPDATYTSEKTIYLDNYRTYKGGEEYYTKAKDALPVADLSEVDVLDGNINLPADTTVADFREMISTEANVRVYKNDSYSSALEDNDVMGAGNMVVFATNNKRTTERAYSYYTVNRPLVISKINLVNEDGKTVKGSLSDIKNIGEAYYLETAIINKATSATATLNAILASYDENGKMIDFVSNTVTVAPGTTKISSSENAVKFEGLDVKEDCTVKAFLWADDSNEPMCEEFSAVFNGKEEYHILAFGNSYGNDSFAYLPAIAAADGVDIYAVNMYKGSCAISMHYDYMQGNGTYEKRIENTPDGTITTENVSFDDGLNTYGYSWDYITLQSRGAESYDFDYFYTESKPYITELADYIRKQSPRSEVLFFETWARSTEVAVSSDPTMDMVAGMDEAEVRPYIFSLIKANYLKAAETIGNPNRVIPVGEAINYAIGTLGFAEIEKDDEGNYVTAGRSMYRDTTSHLTIPYGRVLAGLTWYEYITGNDARANSYTNTSIPEEDMELLKAAAHYACSLAEYNAD